MARKKITKKTSVKTAKRTKSTKPKVVTKKSENLSTSFRKQLKLEESYVSLLLGAGVVIVVAILALVLLSQNGTKTSVVVPSPVVQKVSPTPTTTVYVLQEDESIWDVAVKFYGDGFRWIDIAKTNQIEESADYVAPGTKLIIPQK